MLVSGFMWVFPLYACSTLTDCTYKVYCGGRECLESDRTPVWSTEQISLWPNPDATTLIETYRDSERLLSKTWSLRLRLDSLWLIHKNDLHGIISIISERFELICRRPATKSSRMQHQTLWVSFVDVNTVNFTNDSHSKLPIPNHPLDACRDRRQCRFAGGIVQDIEHHCSGSNSAIRAGYLTKLDHYQSDGICKLEGYIICST